MTPNDTCNHATEAGNPHWIAFPDSENMVGITMSFMLTQAEADELAEHMADLFEAHLNARLDSTK